MNSTRDMTIHYSSKRPDWATPSELFATLDAEFDFTLDAAASDDNTKVPTRYFTEADDALTQPWTGIDGAPARAFVNPPYGRGIGKWVEKAIRESHRGATVVMLVPARTDSVWFQELAAHAQEVRLLAGRVTFEGASEPAPFPSAIAVLRPITAWSRTPGVQYSMPTRHDRTNPWTTMHAIRRRPEQDHLPGNHGSTPAHSLSASNTTSVDPLT